MNVKGRQTKLLAAIAVLAMVVCALAVVLPSGVDGETFEVGTDDDLQQVIDDAAVGDEIVLTAAKYGSGGDSVGGYTIYTVDKAITITSEAKTKPTIYGTFNVTADGVTFSNLKIVPYGNNENDQSMKSAINFYGNSITITGCDIALEADRVANGIMIYPTVDGAVNYNIADNTISGIKGVQDNWTSTAVYICQDFPAKEGFTSAVVDLGVNDAFDLYESNEFKNNANAVIIDNWAGTTENYDNYAGVYILDSVFDCNTAGMVSYVPEGRTVTSNANTATVAGVVYNFGTIDARTNDLSGDGTIYDFGIINGTNSVSNTTDGKAIDGTVTQESVNAAFSNDNELVMINAGTVGSIKVPATGQTLIIGAGATVSANAQFTVPAGAVIEFQDEMTSTNFSVVGGTTTTATVQFSNMSGNFTVTGGSVIVDGTITGGNIGTGDVGNEVTIAGGAVIDGDVTISGSGKVTFAGALTITENGKLTLNDGVEYVMSGALTNDGSLVLNGDVDSTGAVQTAEGLGTITGTGTLKVNGAVTGLTHVVAIWTESVAGVIYYFPGIETIELDAQQVAVAGSGITEEITIIAGDSEVQITAAGDKVAYSFKDNQTYGTGLYVLGTADEISTGIYNTSSATIVSIGDHVVIGGVVALGDVDIPYDEEKANVPYIEVPAGASLVIPAGTETVFLAGDIGEKEELISQASIDNQGTIFVYGTLALGTDAVANKCISNAGTVYALDDSTVKLFVTNSGSGSVKAIEDVTITIDDAETAYADLVANLGKGLPIKIDCEVTVPANERLDISNENIIFTANGKITVLGSAALSITDSVLDKAEPAAGATNNAMIVVNEKAKLEIVDSKIFMVVSADEKASVTVDNADVKYDNTTSNVKVGY